MEEAAAERRYKAFISYRHRPLDMAIAKKLHKRIERYVIPKDLRKNEKKKLGLVFRDQDELPIANNLSENIRIALDHAEFLIVICSPDTPQSIWVQREISYFLEHHSRDNVLAVLISGEPDESFPPQLTEVRSPDGDLLETIEPLAANIVADSDAKRNQLFKTESLRILASLIGCPYDALYRREQRYKMRRLAVAAIGIIAIAAAFIGLLLNRNAMIQEQLRTTQINESRTLAALSENASRDGDYRGALEDALNALPGRSPGRPYVAEAEKALGELVQPYRRGIQCLRFLQSVKQKSGSWQRHKTAHGLQLLTEPVRFTCMISIPEKKNGPLFSRKRFTICLPWKIQVFMFLAMVHRRYSIPWKTVIFCGKKKTAIFPRTLFVPPKDGYWR